MRRTPLFLAALSLALPTGLVGQSHQHTPEDLVANALSAAPASVTGEATVVNHDKSVLREGSNGWVCLPDMPEVPNNSPMCLDEIWLGVFDALLNGRQPSYEGVGIGYMLQGDMPVSNIDPAATEPTPDNQWVANSGPHVMLLVSDAALLETLPTDPENGGPWVMWKGTPFVHVMIPTPAAPTPH